MSSLDHVSSLLADHIDRVLNTTIRDDWHHRSVNDPQISDAMDFELWVDNSLTNVLGETIGSTRMEGCLAPIQDRSLHLLIVVQWHVPWILADNNVLEALSFRQNVVAKPDAFAHCNDVEIIGKEVQIDVRLYQRVGAIKRHLSWIRNGPH